MLKENGKVVAVDDDGLWVETLKQSACAQCAAKHGCGQKLLSEISPSSNMTLVKAFFTDSSGQYEWSEGDQAILGVEENALVLATIVLYGLPLVSMLLGMFAGHHLSSGKELYAVIGAAAGLFLGGWVVKLHGRMTQHKPFYQAHVIGKGLAHSG